MSSRLPIVAAIPNYNMGEQLTELLPQLRRQDYAEIFVLDDASTDGSRDIVDGLDLDVVFVAGEENKGAGAARNLIIGALGNQSIIHFIDADTELLTDRVVERLDGALPTEPFGFLGGYVEDNNGFQSVWNYGPRQCLRSDTGAIIQSRVEELLTSDEDRAKRLRDRFSGLLADWPNPFADPEHRRVFWAIEVNFFVDSSVFEEVGGFNDKIREHDIQDMAIRMYQADLPRYFDPSIAVRHKAVQVRDYNRRMEMMKAEVDIHRKYGLLNWFRPGGSFRPQL